jgi:hypothetical protein
MGVAHKLLHRDIQVLIGSCRLLVRTFRYFDFDPLVLLNKKFVVAFQTQMLRSSSSNRGSGKREISESGN